MKYALLLLWLCFFYVGCAKETCSPSAYWNCIFKEMSKNSCSYLRTNNKLVGQTVAQSCTNNITKGLSADKQATCKQKLLKENIGTRMQQIVDTMLSKCGF